MNTEEYAQITRSMIQHENELINHRMGWMWALQGLLAAAASFIWKNEVAVVQLLCAFGFLSSISFALCFRSSTRAIDKLHQGWKDYASKHPGYEGPPVIGAFEPNKIFTYLYPWYSLPWLSALFWMTLAWIRTRYIG